MTATFGSSNLSSPAKIFKRSENVGNIEKEKTLLDGKGEQDWITVNGTHIPIKDGETPKQAIKNRFDNKTKPNDKPLTNQVDDVLNNTFKGSHIKLLEDTPKVLQDLGVPNKPLLITKKHTYLAINKDGIYKGKDDHYHYLGKDLFLQIPTLLKSPIMVFQNKEDIVAVVNAVDKKGSPVIVPIKINGQGKDNYIQIETHIAKSVYGRENFQNYIDKHVSKDDILLIENKKIRNYISKR